MQGIGYKEVVEYLHKKINKDKCEELMKRNTHYLAKKQRTWFRRYIADAQMNNNPEIVFQTFMLD
jgi:tRNA A37 N6-isopentenylltransferase MiaA